MQMWHIKAELVCVFAAFANSVCDHLYAISTFTFKAEYVHHIRVDLLKDHNLKALNKPICEIEFVWQMAFHI